KAHDDPEELWPLHPGAKQGGRHRTGQERPIHEVVGVVPPVDRVVEVERVADRVDEERRHEQDVRGVRVWQTTTADDPDRRHEQSRNRVPDQAPAESLPGKALETGESTEGEEYNERKLDREVEPEGPRPILVRHTGNRRRRNSASAGFAGARTLTPLG